MGMEEWNAKVNLSQSSMRKSESLNRIEPERSEEEGCLNKKRSLLSVSARWATGHGHERFSFFFLPRSHLIPSYPIRLATRLA